MYYDSIYSAENIFRKNSVTWEMVLHLTLQLTWVFNENVLSSKEQLELLSTSHTGLIQNASLIYMTRVRSDCLENIKDFSS